MLEDLGGAGEGGDAGADLGPLALLEEEPLLQQVGRVSLRRLFLQKDLKIGNTPIWRKKITQI